MAKRHLTHTKTKKKITIYVPKSHEDKFGKLQDKDKGYSSQLEKDFLVQLVKNPKNMPKGYYASKGNLDDFGKALNSGAHLSSLRRTKIGDFSINDAIEINEFVESLKKN